MTFEIERLYHRRREIHDVYGGQRQGGISTPSDGPYIFLFTGEAGEQHGYIDGFDDSGIFIYTGEGQRGDMQFVRGNKAIRDHAQDGRDLLLFAATAKSGYYRYKGAFVCAGYDDTRSGPDTEGNPRRLIRFQLVPIAALTEDAAAFDPSEDESNQEDSLKVLRGRAYEAGAAPATKDVATSKRSLYRRSSAVKRYVLARAAGFCECCKKPAPFKKKNGHPYLEPHHIRQLSDDGLDSPYWVGAICPTCHREIHHGAGGALKNDALAEHIRDLERSIAECMPSVAAT